MRISKEPEERKQEILETAMQLFAEKGYEKTSISDIAKKIGVAQGLCYRYFPSKDILFQTAINEYADILVNKLKLKNSVKQVSIKDIITHMEVLSENANDIYYDTFHNEKNKTFHDLLFLSVCQKLVPIVAKLIENGNATGELHVSDIESYANFCVYGQLGILADETLSSEEKNKKIKAVLFDLFNL
ncbi:TetR/AcrR family transcriptional regulator [Peptacetobacter sp.]|uniref:TetR/AcrR family transcriptional regulator n=1 Tax=Peptacetobacter sp. TaxID=2991975 RepID=UPI00260A9A0D|nr:TetR/AcrR family transcriptional regulator [Peptacetobacter sp.]